MKKYVVTVVMSLMVLCLNSQISFAKGKEKEADLSYQYKETRIELPKETVEVISMEVLKDGKVMIATTTRENENCIIWKQSDAKEWNKVMDVNEVLQERGMVYSERNNITISESGEIIISVFENANVNWMSFNEKGNIIEEKMIVVSSLLEGLTAKHMVVDENIVLLQGLSGGLYLYHADSEKLFFLNEEKEFNVAIYLQEKNLYALTTRGLRIINLETMEETECSTWGTQIEKRMQENYLGIVKMEVLKENGEEMLCLAQKNGIMKLEGTEKIELLDGKKTNFADTNDVLRHVDYYKQDIFVVVQNEENETSIAELYQYSYQK